MKKKISVVIPAYNEEKSIRNSIRSAAKGENVEIIVVDGGSADKTFEIAKAEKVRTFRSPLGRAVQMNRGAGAAEGRHLLFLHADTVLPEKFDLEVRRLLEKKRVAAGAFRLKIDRGGRLARIIERLVNLRSKWLKLPYGDQAFFMKKSVFDKTGGFPELPILEDFVYIRKLGKTGGISISKSAAITSGRRWRKLGFFRTTLVNQLILTGYFLGVSPSRLKNLRRKLN